MGKARFLYDNLITDDSMLALSSLRAGVVSGALKEGVGSATLNPGGSYTGSTDKEYTVEIDSIAAGAEVGQATFKWSDGEAGWNATGVATSASDIVLNSGVRVNFTTGSGADFAVGDKWYFKGINLFGAGKLIDRDRDTRNRSAVLEAPNTITITLASPAEVEAIVLGDHNLTSGAVITLEANSIDSWLSGTGLWDDIEDVDAVPNIDDLSFGVPPFSEAIAWSAEQIVHYLSTAQTYKYWQIQITDALNPDGYIEIGEIFLGPYLELSRNYREGYSEEMNFLMETNRTPYGVRRDRFYNFQSTFSFDFERMPTADVTGMKTMIAAIGSRSAGTFKPVWFNKDSATPNETWLVAPASLPVNHRRLSDFNMPLVMEEVVTSV